MLSTISTFSSPYFLPNEAILTAIKVASLSGIDVRIMIPSRSDSKIVYWASRSYIEELIDANVKVYLYRRGFNHSKLIMIDGKFSSVGTANMDIRSFEDNFEVSAILYDKGITEELEERFLYDLQRSRLVTREYWDSRPTLHNFYEALSRLFSPSALSTISVRQSLYRHGCPEEIFVLGGGQSLG